MRTERQRAGLALGRLKIALLTALLCAIPARAQQSLAQLSYEGQPVASVDLVAAPDVSLQPLWPLVKLQAHQPYSEAKAQATISALRTAGHFQQVDLQVTPEADGLRVTFLLQPVYYLGLISFLNPVSRFNYSQLLQMANYPDETPYESSRAQQAGGRLQGFFANEGYFLAHVGERPQFDPEHKLANLTYAVTPGKQARFGDIQVTGPPPAEAKRVQGALHSIRARLRGGDIKAGKPYSPERVSRASRTLQTYAGDHGWLANHVTLAKPQYNAETNRVPIDFRVELGPKVRVRVIGARLRGKTLKTLIPIYEERAVDRDLVTEGARNLTTYFQSKGYFDARVQTRFVRNPSEILITYQVQRGHRHKVVAIRFAGNRHLSEGALRPLVTTQTAHFFSRGKYGEDLLSQSVNNLTNFYHNAGFESVRVQPKVADVDPNLYITFQITEGPQTLVSAVRVNGLQTQTLARLAPEGLQLRAGRPFSPAAAERDRDRIVAAYLNLGYPQVSFQATSSPLPKNPYRVNVTYTIHEGPQTRIQAVQILGERHTKPIFIQHNAKLQPGAPLSQGALLQAESTLYSLGIFDWADVTPAQPVTTPGQAGASPAGTDPAHPASRPQASDQDQERQAADVLVKVHEAKRNQLTYGFGFLSTPRTGQISTGILQLPGLPTIGLPASFKPIEKTIISPEGSVGYSRKNLFGSDETGSVSAVISRLDQHLSLTYSVPQFRGPVWSYLVSFSAERTTQNPLFTARLGQVSLQFDRALNRSRTERLEFSYSFQRTNLTDLLIQGFVLPQDQSIRTSTLSASFIRDTRDNAIDAHRGVFETVNFGLTPSVFGSSDSFARLFGQAASYRQIKPWMVWANRVEAGVVSAFGGSHVPLSERFFSGGADSLRGFPINGAGPQTTALLCTQANNPSTCTAKVQVPVGGPQLFILNSEGRFPIPLNKNLGGVIFYDGGNVFNRIGFSHFFSQYSNTVGFGLRYNTPVGPVRIDIGRNLNPAPGFKATQIFVTLGQAF